MTVEGAIVDTGLPVTLDSRPLSRLGEALALVAGRGTFSLQRFAGRLEIANRDQFRIRGQPAGINGVDVLVRHECDKAGNDLPRTASNIPGIRQSALLPDQPPY